MWNREIPAYKLFIRRSETAHFFAENNNFLIIIRSQKLNNMYFSYFVCRKNCLKLKQHV